MRDRVGDGTFCVNYADGVTDIDLAALLRSHGESGRAVLERDPLERLAAEGRLNSYRHTGFWECMDTYKDAVQLNDLWKSGRAPWGLWR